MLQCRINLEMLRCSMYVGVRTKTPERSGTDPERFYTMAKTQDFTAVFKDMMGSFPVDTKAMEEQFKTQSTLAEKLSSVTINAAGKSTELSAKWAQDTLGKMQAMASAKTEPADYAKSMSDFTSSSAEAAAEHMAAFAEIAKKVQTETLELMMAAGKDMSEDMSTAAKKASDDMQTAAKKATDEMTSAAKKASASK